VRLFLERARDVRPDFDLTAENAAAVGDICRRLDGLPLAIELAAARVRLLPPSALLSRLDHSLALLTGGARDLPDRQRTLRATVAWSYELLSPEEALLLDRLAVFAGGFSLEAVEEVCSLDGDLDVLESLAGLVDQSLVVRREIESGEPRYSLLEIIREFAQERMAGRGEAERLLARHATYYLALGETAETQLSGPQQVAWQAALSRERDNLSQTLEWFRQSEAWVELARLAGSLGRHWLITGEYSEGAEWLQQALDHAESLDAGSWGKVLSAAGVLGAVRRDPRAREMLEQALALHPETGDVRARASTLNVLGILADEGQEYARATALFEESLALFRELGEPGGVGAVLLNLAWVAVYQGDLSRAEQLAQEARTVAEQGGDVSRLTASLLDLGWVAYYGGRLEAAAAYFVQAADPAGRLDDRLALADVIDGLGRVAAGRGRDERGIRLYAAAEALRRRLGTPLSPADQERFEAAVVTSRARLEEEAFNARWAEGESLSEEAALAEALTEAAMAEAMSERPEEVRPA
jgi:tetratricopeptide (TPR) repeat protein